MAEYIEREAVRRCIHKWLADIFGIDNPELTVLDKRINAIPAADVVPVVRCGECRIWDKHWMLNYSKDDEHFCPELAIVTHADWYCANGERKGGGE